MNLLAKKVLQHGLSAVFGVGAATAAVALVSTGAHESITLAIGDTIVPRFSIRTDSVLRAPGGGNIVVRACGQSAIYLRTYKGPLQRSADTVDVTVPCAPPADTLTPIASITVCFLPADTAAKYGLRGDISPSPEQLSHVTCDSTANLSLAASHRTQQYELQHPRIASTMFRRPDSIPIAPR